MKQKMLKNANIWTLPNIKTAKYACCMCEKHAIFICWEHIKSLF